MIGSKRIGLANTVVLAIPAASLLSYVVVGAAGGFTANGAIIAWTIGRVIGAVLAIGLVARTIGLERGHALREANKRSLGYGLRSVSEFAR